ncbi:MAG: hypothetical protein ACNI25_09000 [Halarcobacter sp.]
MNSVSNTIYKKLIIYIYIILFAYILNTVLFIFLPKSGVEFVDEDNVSINYKKYSGFYSLSNNSDVAKPKEIKTVATLSKYQLKAVYSTSTNGGWAIIEDKSSHKSIILAQYEKFNAYTLTKLFKTYIVFEKNLKEFKLELPTDEDVKYELTNNLSNNTKEKISFSNGKIKVKRDYLNSYVNDIDKVWNNIAITDVRVGNKIEGFKVDRVNLNSVFGKLGLVKGDVIKSINGTKMNSYADAFKVYNQINNIDYLSIEVLRNNEIVELNYEID